MAISGREADGGGLGGCEGAVAAGRRAAGILGLKAGPPFFLNIELIVNRNYHACIVCDLISGRSVDISGLKQQSSEVEDSEAENYARRATQKKVEGK